MTGMSLSWLKQDADNQDKALVKVLRCSACTKFDSSIRGMNNYPSAWITGSTNNRASNVTDHATSEQHKIAMFHLRTERAPVAKRCPITISLLALKKPICRKSSTKNLISAM